MDYIWLFYLGGIATVSLLIFLMTLSKDTFLLTKLRKSKSGFLLNFSLLFITLGDLGIIIYLFNLLREQIDLLS
ncbi:hypothetical protein DOK67_0001069 [Enterococcus sp. DIV0212c]|uniref:Uncharacterized protein n=1 Tax=Candidatus Enterococcus palustris TaxID=1834189 RepID=A0AAQ3WA46_9ENTE|nr:MULTISPECIES: hypothetical protein [unclassified Enterococcus]OTN82951.1 hypothetical protein A5821_002874 [Enterococcus sp. 7F3_DIV0205]